MGTAEAAQIFERACAGGGRCYAGGVAGAGVDALSGCLSAVAVGQRVCGRACADGDDPRYPDVENGRRMPQIGFSQNGDWDKRSGQYERGGADSRSIKMPRQHLTHDEAEEWCDSMVNADGTKGCHWTLEQTQDVAKQRNINCDPNDFWAVMNMMYSDYCQVAKRQSVDTPGFYADMAKAFLEDTDAADGKAYLYWECIADK